MTIYIAMTRWDAKLQGKHWEKGLCNFNIFSGVTLSWYPFLFFLSMSLAVIRLYFLSFPPILLSLFFKDLW